MRGTKAMLPQCEYCGRFVNPVKDKTLVSWLVYSYGSAPSIDREAFAHPACSEKEAKRTNDIIERRIIQNGYLANV